ncbi:GNAT family protein [Roseobacter sp. HKCCA0434]|uniref:GNAT family N-acetyltransferase n=1 Tax=Roseobacter sp. HKCCA0434 TaxID=3079297 RepID=UPI002905CEF8|nr:GNAT family protein [Roseobacter sp. HKCCA0434]
MPHWPDRFSAAMDHAELVPLSHHHAADLAGASAEGELSRLWYTTIPAPENMAAEIDRRLGLEAEGRMRPFAIRACGRAVGMTSYMNIDAANRRLEIGSTWLAPSAQRGPVNTECKRMLLGHAFDDLDCIAVELRTHVMNRQSRAAIERLGARLDGILRAHMILPNGTIRDTAVYSITAADWPSARAGLDFRLGR